MEYKGFSYVIAGVESDLKKIIEMVEGGYKIDGIKVGYDILQQRGEKSIEYIDKLRELGVKVWLDSGGFGLRYAKMIKDGHKDEEIKQYVKKDFLKIVEDKEKIMEFVKGYLEFLDKYGNHFDYVIEMDIGNVVGKEELYDIRRKIIRIVGKDKVMLVYHKEDETYDDLVEFMEEEGVDYVGFVWVEWQRGLITTMRNLGDGVRKHIFGFNEMDKRYGQYLFSADTSLWLYPKKYGKFLIQRDKKLEVMYKDDKLKILQTLRKHRDVWKKLGWDVEKWLDEDDWKNLSYAWIVVLLEWKRSIYPDIDEIEMYRNLVMNTPELTDETKQWILKDLNKGFIPEYLKEMKRIIESGEKLPDYVNDTDKVGRKKIMYLKLRYGNYRHGAYARVVQTYSLYCDNCPVKDKCPMYEPGGVCYFIPFWRQIGNTRNKEAVINVMERIVREKYMRYMRARYFEDLEGGVPDKAVSKLEDDLLKALELLIKVKFGSGVNNVNIYAMSREGDANININFGEAYREIEEMYGKELAEKVKKRIKLQKPEP